jgi:uncharacterized damage-inducible protein DinB
MARELCESLWSQWEHALNMLETSIREFTPEQWSRGISGFETPAKVAYHNTDVIDFFFRENREVEFKWGHRFGKPWWELYDDEQPTPEEQLAYMADLKKRVKAHFAALEDNQLYEPFEKRPTRLEYYLYALRHTMHHQGALNALSVYHGNDTDNWE